MESKKKSAYTPAHIRAQKKYDDENIVVITLRINRKTDADILERLEGVDNKQGFIKGLIRKGMKKP